jgi:fructokinase
MAVPKPARLVGGIEAGGTKFVCALGTGPDDVRARVDVPTTTPGVTLARVLDFFTRQPELRPAAVGVASFGPLDRDPRSATFGFITSTPKPAWSETDVVGPLRRGLGVPIAFDTDVNGAALAEHRWGAGRGLDVFVYVTVGTGIGGGAVVEDRLVHGLVHPEMGHLRVPHDQNKDPFPGTCPYHGDCLEGLASGPAMQARWGVPPERLPPEHPAWALETEYLALGLASVIAVLSPRRIAIGGGVAGAAGLLPRVRARLPALLAGYLRAPALVEGLDQYVVPPTLGATAGVLGGVALAHEVLRDRPP